MGFNNLRVIVPVVYAIAVVVALAINRTAGAVVVVAGGVLVALFFMSYSRRARRS